MRFKKYLLYFCLVVLAGGAGCWISLVQYLVGPQQAAYDAFIGNLATFAISVAFLAFADQILISAGSPDADRDLFLLIMVIVTLGLSAFSMLVSKIDVTKYAVSGAITSLACWGIVNLRNRALFEEIKPVTTLGGDLNGGG